MMTEKTDIYGLPPGILSDTIGLPTLEPLWWGVDEPGMDDLYDKAGRDSESEGSLRKTMIDRLKIYPVNIKTKDNPTLFLAQFKLDQSVEQAGTVNINFMISFPIDTLEMMVLIGQYSSLPSTVDAVPGDDKPIPPLPTELFTWPEKDRIVFNKMYVAVQESAYGLTTKMFADSLGGEDPQYHWWFNVLFAKKQADQKKFPVPGEFLSLGVRIFIDKIWGKQKSNPFIYSGNWFATVYYDSAVIIDVIPPTNIKPYSTYTVTWHGLEQEITKVKPSDFCEYRVGDRVTILKDVTTDKTVQRWDDDDMKTFGEGWVIAPITFYGLEIKET